MGYILPLSLYQYNDYQKRVTKDKLDLFYIEKLYKVVLESKHQDLEDEVNRMEAVSKSRSKLTAPTPPTNEKMYSELTGKGQFYSESI